ncbi:MAG: sodium transporter [Bacteroidetes bacterium]|nr:MAG: sodium transporter [Bacteroidota bacterium]
MNYIDYLVIAVYIIGFLFLGKLFSGSKSGEDYFLGGKSFGFGALTFSTIATQLSAISFVSAPAFVGLKAGGGMMWLTYEFAVPLAMLFLLTFLIPPMYKAGIVSVYAYLEKRFSSSTRILLSAVFQLSRAFATGVMVYTVALILMSVMEIELWQTVLVIGVITLIYSYQGGMKAVVYGDVIQMIILLLGIVVCLIMGLHYLGGWGVLIDNLDPARLQAVNFDAMGFEEGDDFGFWPMLIGGLFLYTSYYGTDQSQVQRLFAAKDLNTVKLTLLSNGLLRFPITFVYCVMGLVIGTFVMMQPEFKAAIPADKPDYMIPIFIRDYLPHGLIGLLMVAIFSAAMSSLSSGINSLSAATVEDFFNRRGQLDTETHLRYSKYATLFWGTVCILLAFFTGDIAKTVIEAINKVGSVFYGPILATFIAAVGLRFIHAQAINVGILMGVATNVYLWLFVPEVFWFWWNVSGALVTLGVAALVSLVLPAAKVSTNVPTFDAHAWEIDWPKTVVLLGYFLLIIWVSLQVPAIFS